MQILTVGVVSSWVGLVAMFVVGGMQIGAAQERIDQNETNIEKHDQIFEQQRIEQRETRDRTIRIEQQTRSIEDSLKRIDDRLIRALQ